MGQGRANERAAVRRFLSEGIDDPAVVLDDGAVVAVNSPAVEAFAPGRGVADLRGEPVDALLGSNADLPPAGETATFGGRDGRTYEVRVSSAGDGWDRVLLFRDVTARERRVRRLRILNRVLRQDLRNELAGITGRAEYVRDAIAEAEVLSEARDAAEAIVESARELAEVGRKAQALQAAFEAETGEAARVDLVPIVASLLEDLREEFPDAKVDADLPGRAPARAVSSLEAAVEAVLENACEHNDAPVPRVDVTVERSDGSVAVVVADNGPGIPREARAVPTSGEVAGLERGGGLGLRLARWVVDASGGELSFDENVPRGSVVTIEVPAAEEA